MPSEIQKFVFGSESHRYLKEVITALREVTSCTYHIIDMLVCCSYNNSDFSLEVLKLIMDQYSNAPSNELRNIFTLLADVLLLEDSLQIKRLQCIIDGYTDAEDVTYDGMLAIIKKNHMNESRRSYHCVKFLVHLAHKCAIAKDYLIQMPSKWQWVVNWLKRKMNNGWNPPVFSHVSNEDSNSKTFQRTMSAQDTLADATALLTELPSQDVSDMDTSSDSNDKEEPYQVDNCPEEISELFS